MLIWITVTRDLEFGVSSLRWRRQRASRANVRRPTHRLASAMNSSTRTGRWVAV